MTKSPRRANELRSIETGGRNVEIKSFQLDTTSSSTWLPRIGEFLFRLHELEIRKHSAKEIRKIRKNSLRKLGTVQILLALSDLKCENSINKMCP